MNNNNDLNNDLYDICGALIPARPLTVPDLAWHVKAALARAGVEAVVQVWGEDVPFFSVWVDDLRRAKAVLAPITTLPDGREPWGLAWVSDAGFAPALVYDPSTGALTWGCAPDTGRWVLARIPAQVKIGRIEDWSAIARLPLRRGATSNIIAEEVQMK